VTKPSSTLAAEKIMSQTRCLLTIAGTDPSGGAGIQMDLQVFRDFGFHGLSVISALVCQSTSEVRGFAGMEAGLVADQLDTLLDDITPAGIKIGMLPTAEVVEAVAAAVERVRRGGRPCPVVFDPVLASGSRHELVEPGCLEAMRRRLAPLVDVLTPNVDEAQAFLGASIRSRADFEGAAGDLLGLGCGAVLLKAGHLEEEADEGRISDVFADASGVHSLRDLPTIDDDVRGTGCQLSSALLACMVAGRSSGDGDGDGEDSAAMIQAVEEARAYLNALLHTQRRNIGRGRLVITRAHPYHPPRFNP
jgi:hydroxymethylpyrimidine/phosphomethylpyrimidine kinase